MTIKQLSVRLYGQPLGILEQTSAGKMSFSYHSSATKALSVGMPIREEPYGEVESEAYFGGLLPESEIVKRILAKRYRVSPHNHFALLKAIGYDCAGAISCHEIHEPIQEHQPFPLTAKIIPEDALYQHIKELPPKPLFMDVDGLRLSLAGVQDKAAVCMLDGKIALAEDGCPTTHIIKPATIHFAGITENEYFCMKLAKAVGLTVPNIQLKKINDITFLLIERYDRQVKEGYVSRIHQEDFCQALGIPSLKKYQNEGGPGFKQCFELLKYTAQPALGRNQIAAALVFNYLIGNMDAHGKNFSILHISPQNIQLAPFYDIVCTRVYQDLSTKMAMKIGSKYDAKHIYPAQWEELCKEIQYRYLAMKKLIETQAGIILKKAINEREAMMAEGHNIEVVNKIIEFLETNINNVIHRFSIS